MVEGGKAGSGEARLEKWISYILVIGVVSSLVIEVAGIILFYHAFHSLAVSQDTAMFIHGRDFFTFLGQSAYATAHGITAVHLMVLGIAILILTPYARAVVSVAYFAAMRNIKYLVITLFVLLVLTLSLAAH